MSNYHDFWPCPTHPYTTVDEKYGDFCLEFDDKVHKLHKKYVHNDATTKLPHKWHQPALTAKQLIEYINILIKGRKPSYVATRAAFDFEQQTFINDDYTTYETTT